MRILLFFVILLIPFNSFANETISFNGKIKDSPITANITISENKNISGYYYYNRYKTKIPLVGEYVKDESGKYWKHIQLKTIDEKIGETLSGYIEYRENPTNPSKRIMEIEGVWWNKQNNRGSFLLFQNTKLDLDRDFCKKLFSDYERTENKDAIQTMYQCQKLGIYTAVEEAGGSAGDALWVSSEEAISRWLLDSEVARARLIITDKEKAKLFNESQDAWSKFSELQCKIENEFRRPWVGTNYNQSYGGYQERMCLFTIRYSRAAKLNSIFTWQTQDWHNEHKN